MPYSRVKMIALSAFQRRSFRLLLAKSDAAEDAVAMSIIRHRVCIQVADVPSQTKAGGFGVPMS
jgi:hypothetical protein